MIAALFVETGAATTACRMSIRGIENAMRGSTLGRIRSWRIRLANAGAGTGTARRASRINTSSAMTAAVSLRRWPP